MSEIKQARLIRTKNGHRVIKDENGEVIYIGIPRTVEDYIDECLHGNNECAELLEKFDIISSEGIRRNKDAIVWFDWETNETFISY